MTSHAERLRSFFKIITIFSLVVSANVPAQEHGTPAAKPKREPVRGVIEAPGPARNQNRDLCTYKGGMDRCIIDFFSVVNELLDKNRALFKRLATACENGSTPNIKDANQAKKLIISLGEKKADLYTMVSTAYGEARGLKQGKVDPPYRPDNSGTNHNPIIRANMLLVMRSAQNRLHQIESGSDKVSGDSNPTLAKILLQPFQYSAWNPNDVNSACLLSMGMAKLPPGEDLSPIRALQAYLDFRGPNKVSKGLDEATHYYASWLKRAPAWSNKKAAVSPATVRLPPPPSPNGYLVTLGNGTYHKFFKNIPWSFNDAFQ